jgi:aspartate-semialdehyde dehydrogenase
MKIALVGATGLVGGMMMKVLEEENFPITEFYPVASEKSVGKQLTFKEKQYTILSIDEAIAKQPHIALFSAGGTISKQQAPKFAAAGTTVIDNSSAWRMDESVKLVVPEINGNTLSAQDKIIANPNCSTIQMVMALAPLHKQYGIKRLVISTYQSITGTGQKAVTQLQDERNGVEGEKAYPYAIDMNCIPHCDTFLENGYTKEEMKLVNETRKILSDDSIKITATAVRIPVMGGHSESVNVEFNKPFDIDEVRNLLNDTNGVKVVDDVQNHKYPMPMTASNRNEVFVGRIRRDESLENGLNMWIVADNLRKGAATNAVQIAKIIEEKIAVIS